MSLVEKDVFNDISKMILNVILVNAIFVDSVHCLMIHLVSFELYKPYLKFITNPSQMMPNGLIFLAQQE